MQWSSFIAVNYPARKYGISRFGKDLVSVEEARKRCPELRVVHVATYKEGQAEPGYFDKPDPLTHKVGSFIQFSPLNLEHCSRCPWTTTGGRAKRYTSLSPTVYLQALQVLLLPAAHFDGS